MNSPKLERSHKEMMTSLTFRTAILACLVSLCVISRAAAQEKSAEVHIDNFSFTPVEITVSPGTTLTWVNGDDIPHNVVATGNAFRSKVMDTEQKFSFTFGTPGVYEYFCALHPHMKGKVIVK
jgi:plastocyanin